MDKTQDWYPAPYIKRLVDAGITLPADSAEVLMLVLNDVRADAVKGQDERVRALEAALRLLLDNAQRVEWDCYMLQGYEDFQPEDALEATRALLGDPQP
jgi:hypothetical protein